MLKYSVLFLLILSCTSKLSNDYSESALLCGPSANDWPADSFTKVFDAEGQPVDRKFLSVSSSGKQVKLSEKSCVQNSAIDGELVIRDNRPNFKHAGILKATMGNFPRNFNLQPIDDFRPAYSCNNSRIYLNSMDLRLDIETWNFEPDHHKFLVSLNGKELNLSLEKDLFVLDLPKKLIDGSYPIQVSAHNKLNNKNFSLAECQLILDRKKPSFSYLPESSTSKKAGLLELASNTKWKLTLDDIGTDVFIAKLPAGKTCEQGEYLPLALFEMPVDGEWTICSYARDQAGNESELMTKSIKIRQSDKEALINERLKNSVLELAQGNEEGALISVLAAAKEIAGLKMARDRRNSLGSLKGAILEVLAKSRLIRSRRVDSVSLYSHEKNMLVVTESGFRILDENLGDLADVKGIEAFFETIALAPNNLVSAGDDQGQVWIFMADGRSKSIQVSDDQRSIYRGTLSTDGTSFIVTDISGKVFAINAEGKLLGQGEFDSLPVAIEGISQREIIVMTSDNQLYRYDFLTNKKTLISKFEHKQHEIDFNKSTKQVLISGDYSFTILDLKTNKVQTTTMDSGILIDDLAFNSKYISVLDSNDKILLYDYNMNLVRLESEVSPKSYEIIVMDENMIASSDEQGGISVFDSKLRLLSYFKAHNSEIVDVQLMDGKIISKDYFELKKWDVHSKAFERFDIRSEHPQRGLSTLKVSDKSIYYSLDDGSLYRIRDGKNNRLWTGHNDGNAYLSILSPDASIGLLYHVASETLEIKDVESGRSLSSKIKVGPLYGDRGISFSPDNRSLFYGYEGEIRQLDLGTMKESSFAKVSPPFYIENLSVSRSGAVVSSGDRRGAMGFHQAGRFAQYVEKSEHDYKVNDSVFLGEDLFAVSEDNSISRWHGSGNLLLKKDLGQEPPFAIEALGDDRITYLDSTNLSIADRSLEMESSIRHDLSEVEILAGGQGQVLGLAQEGEILWLDYSLESLLGKACELGKIRGLAASDLDACSSQNLAH